MFLVFSRATKCTSTFTAVPRALAPGGMFRFARATQCRPPLKLWTAVKVYEAWLYRRTTQAPS